MFSFLENDFWHHVQVYGFSPVCILWWASSALFDTQVFTHVYILGQNFFISRLAGIFFLDLGVGGRKNFKKALKMTSQLGIFSVFFIIFFNISRKNSKTTSKENQQSILNFTIFLKI